MVKNMIIGTTVFGLGLMTNTALGATLSTGTLLYHSTPIGSSLFTNLHSTHTQLVKQHVSSLSVNKDISKNKEYKTAAVCFISDTAACSDGMFGYGEDIEGGSGSSAPDFGLSNRERCYNEGYTISDCPEGYKPGGKRCIYGNYYTECVSTCPSDYVTCEEPYVGVGEACGGKYASCECTPCGEGFDYTEIPEGYEQVGEACLDCDGQTKYKVTPASCDGFQQCGDLGPVFGTETCLSGTTTLYKECKTCPNIGEYSSSSPECSAPFTCSYEDCSGKYYQSGCIEGFTWDETAKTCTCEGVDWCAITPSCTDLGYKQQTCNGPALKCPFNVDYSFCTGECSPLFQYACAGAGYAGGVGTACGGKYTECTCVEGYKFIDGSCIQPAVWGQCSGYAENCALGDILFSDGTCGANKVAGKTPIAVVIYKSSDGNCGQAISLKSVGKYKWSTEYVDISDLPNYVSAATASTDNDSCANTAKIMAAGSKSKYPAAWVAHEYSTDGTSAGDWCLPAVGIFASYYNNQQQVDIGFTNAGGVKITSNVYVWSSTEYSNGAAGTSYLEDFSYGMSNAYYSKNLSREVRPVIEF